MTAGQEDVFYLGSNEHLEHLFLAAGSWHAEDLSSLLSAPTALVGSSLTSYVDSAAQQEDVFYQSGNQHIEHLFFAAGSWRAEDLTTLIGSPVIPVPAVVIYGEAMGGARV